MIDSKKKAAEYWNGMVTRPNGDLWWELANNHRLPSLILARDKQLTDPEACRIADYASECECCRNPLSFSVNLRGGFGFFDEDSARRFSHYVKAHLTAVVMSGYEDCGGDEMSFAGSEICVDNIQINYADGSFDYLPLESEDKK